MSIGQLALVVGLAWPALAWLVIAAFMVRRPVLPTMLVGRHRRRGDGWPDGQRKDHVDG
jgi:hypothetical protein